jgi:hypothetical protein
MANTEFEKPAKRVRLASTRIQDSANAGDFELTTHRQARSQANTDNQTTAMLSNRAAALTKKYPESSTSLDTAASRLAITVSATSTGPSEQHSQAVQGKCSLCP